MEREGKTSTEDNSEQEHAGLAIDVLNSIVVVGIDLSLLEGSNIFLHVHPPPRALGLLPKPARNPKQATASPKTKV